MAPFLNTPKSFYIIALAEGGAYEKSPLISLSVTCGKEVYLPLDTEISPQSSGDYVV